MTSEEATKWIAELFNEDPNDIGPETLRDDIPEWDSIGVLNLMAELDADFEINLTDQQISGMHKVSDLLAVLKENGKLDQT